MTLLAAHQHFQDLTPLEWAVTGAAALSVIWTIYLSVRYTLRPGETEPDHIKRLILEDGAPARTGPASAGAAPAHLPPHAPSSRT